MAVNDDGTLNTKKLQRELIEGLEDDINYRKTDEMKKRAVTVAGTYDEFRNMVLCANQKPVSRQELESLQNTEKGWYNSRAKAGVDGKKKGNSARKGKPSDDGGEIKSTKKIRAPANAMEFERDWRRKCKSEKKKIRYLKLIGPEGLARIFSTEMDATIMSQIIQVLSHFFLANVQEDTLAEDAEPKEKDNKEQLDAVLVFSFLKSLTETGRFALNVHFLSREELQVVTNMFEIIKNHIPENNSSSSIAEQKQDGETKAYVSDNEQYRNGQLKKLDISSIQNLYIP